jgi:hypothetical protein
MRLKTREMKTRDAAISKTGDIVGDIVKMVGAEGQCWVEDG